MFGHRKNFQGNLSNHRDSQRVEPSRLFEEKAYSAIKAVKRRKGFIILFILLLLIAGFIFLVQNYSQKREQQKIFAEYLQIETIYNQETVTFQKKLSETSQQTQISPNNFLPDYSKSSELFNKFAQKHPSSPIAWLAALKAASYYVTMNKGDKIEGTLEQLIKYVPMDSLIQVRVKMTLAGIYASQGSYAKAINDLKSLEKIGETSSALYSNSSLYQPEILFLLAKFLYLNGQKDEAKRTLEKVIAIPQFSPVQQKAKIWLSYISAQS